jgi:UDP-3-O-[3-hydroxymyristoyl] N-acetylglucosamine deacetylase / 3-hydroxyacyl-[acyl-carrier-protein] dehydratase
MTDKIPIYDPTKEPIFDVNDIKKKLPHRYPFLLVDRIYELNKESIVGIKCITSNEPFFPGHFPEEPVFPGVLQIEAMAQTGGVLALNTVGNPESWTTYFLKIDAVKFRKKVVPGDVLVMKLTLLRPIRRGIVLMDAKAYVGESLVCEAELMAQIIENKD